ncbi:unnamed protein product [Owenia fusiformis]|uniref:SAM domain-containing protein n=1 Tax=Owenia fusiformis TaxID=6347 RepID=A0A8S4N2P0_OWEFU|nr:unnamed protein product [Owenia fusiformis]
MIQILHMFLQEHIYGTMADPDSLISQDTFSELLAQLNDVTENGNFTQVNDTTEFEFGGNEVKTTFQMEKYIISGTGQEVLGIPTSQQQQLQQQQLLQQQIQVLPDSATAAASTSPSPYTQMIGTQATSMPSNTEYPGQYGFEVCFGKQQKETKSTTWTYSESLKKLFANLASLCPIKFRCSKSPPPGSVIRALPIYMQPEHIQEPVSRCPNHITKEDPNRDHKSHLIRCENPNTVYYTDQLTNRESLTIPFEEPQAGSDTSVSLFQFMCYSSCVGGLNRRPIQIIFTLETPMGHVIARRVCEVRICACPGRDRKAEEDGATPGNKKSNKKSKNVRVNQVVTTVGPPAKKRKLEDEEVFTLHVRGRENYEVLLKLRDSLELASKVPQPEVEKHNRDYDEINRRMTMNSQLSIPSSSQQGLSTPTPINQVLDRPPSLGLDKLPSLPGLSNLPSIPSFGMSQFFDQIDGKLDAQPAKITEDVHRIKIEPEVTETNEVSSSQSPSTSTNQQSPPITSTQPIDTVEMWLKNIELPAYIDMFKTRGYNFMYQLEDMQQQDLDKLKIGEGHRSKIWRALVEYKNTHDIKGSQTQAQGLSNSSNASTVTIPSQSSGYCPGFYEVTRYTFKHTISLRKDEHNYCARMEVTEEDEQGNVKPKGAKMDT